MRIMTHIPAKQILTVVLLHFVFRGSVRVDDAEPMQDEPSDEVEYRTYNVEDERDDKELASLQEVEVHDEYNVSEYSDESASLQKLEAAAAWVPSGTVWLKQPYHNAYIGMCNWCKGCDGSSFCLYGYRSKPSRAKWIIEKASGGIVYLKQPDHNAYLGVCNYCRGCDSSEHCLYGYTTKKSRTRWVIERTHDGYAHLRQPDHGTYLGMCNHCRGCGGSDYCLYNYKTKKSRTRWLIESEHPDVIGRWAMVRDMSHVNVAVKISETVTTSGGSSVSNSQSSQVTKSVSSSVSAGFPIKFVSIDASIDASLSTTSSRQSTQTISSGWSNSQTREHSADCKSCDAKGSGRKTLFQWVVDSAGYTVKTSAWRCQCGSYAPKGQEWVYTVPECPWTKCADKLCTRSKCTKYT